MILQHLAELYDRLLRDGEIAPPGWQAKEIAWVVELDAEGAFLHLMPTGEDGKRGRKFVVPAEVKRSVNIAANLLWDNAEYVFGAVRDGATPQQAAKVPARHGDFIKRLKDLPPAAQHDAGIKAVRRFLEGGDFSALHAHSLWPALAAGGANVSFRLEGDLCLVCERADVQPALSAGADEDGGLDGQPRCLVSGQHARPAKLHPSIKGIYGGQSSGTSLVSFNLDAFTSHGWEQGDNAPVSEAAARAYTAALNHLLDRGAGDFRRHREGETTFVFWAAAPHEIESLFGEALRDRAEADLDTDGKPIKMTLDALRRGFVEHQGDDTGFFVLTLAPNAARLAVKAWHATTVAEVSKRFAAHFDALEIVGRKGDAPPPKLWRLLAETQPEADIKRLSETLRSRLSEDIVNAVLDERTPYPATLLARVLERCRRENSARPLRVAIVKAVLSRLPHAHQEWSPTVSLDPACTNPGYLLGRLFAVLEYLQYAAQGDINVTIRDRFYGAAMASPLSTYVQLDQLSKAHLKKLRRDKPGLALALDRDIQTILAPLTAQNGLPATLSLEDQGRFLLGYHHQRHSHTPKPAESTDAE